MARYLDSKKTMLFIEVGDEVIVNSNKCNFTEGTVSFSYTKKNKTVYIVSPNPWVNPDEDSVELTEGEFYLSPNVVIKE